MARRGRFLGRVPARGSQRVTEWGASADVAAVQNLAAATAVLDQTFSDATLNAAGVSPSTIVRLRGVIWTKSDTVAAVEQPFGAVSFAVVDQAALDAGVASLNLPITDEPADGFFGFAYFFGGNTALAAGAADGPWFAQEFDSKAMRKIENAQGIGVIVENASVSHGVQYILKFRILFKRT